ERAALEKILDELGPPLRVAQAYSAERTIDEAVSTGRFVPCVRAGGWRVSEAYWAERPSGEAVATGRFVPIVRAVGHLAQTTMVGFFTALGLLVGYATSFAFFALVVLKPIFPGNVGFQYVHGFPV